MRRLVIAVVAGKCRGIVQSARAGRRSGARRRERHDGVEPHAAFKEMLPTFPVEVESRRKAQRPVGFAVLDQIGKRHAKVVMFGIARGEPPGELRR